MLMRSVLLILLGLNTHIAYTQGVMDIKVSNRYMGKSLVEVMNHLEDSVHSKFFFKAGWLSDLMIGENHSGLPLKQVLDDLFKDTQLGYVVFHEKNVVIIKDPSKDSQRLLALGVAKKSNVKIEKVQLGEGVHYKNHEVNLRGRVFELKTGLPVANVNVKVDAISRGTTGANGDFLTKLNSGKNLLSFNAQGFEEKFIDLEIYGDGEIEVLINEAATLLDEVVVEAQTVRETAQTRAGEIHLNVRDIKMAPAFLGEVDLVKQVQNLPGVTTVGEAASGFNVRGGSADQNLILYDGMPVFNSSHAFGFLTAFNPEAVSDVTFYKGGIPAEFGGRTSSILEISSRDGDYKKWNGRASLGLITSGLMLNGPIQREKTALSISLRSTYSNWLLRSVRTNYANLGKSSVYFYDGTAKLTHKISERTKLSITGYSSHDSFNLTADTTYRWQNFQTSTSLDHVFSNTLEATFNAGVSSYSYQIQNDYLTTASELAYRITTATTKAIFKYQPMDYTVKFGGELLFYQTNPGSLKPTSGSSNAAKIKLDSQHSLEASIFGSVEKNLTGKLFFEGGLRVPMFVSYGPSSIYRYQAGQSKDVSTIIDTIHFRSFKTAKVYAGLEPRAAIRFMLQPTTSLKIGYNHIYQFLHLVTNTAAITPVDVWQPSGYHFKPQFANQLSAGFFQDINNRGLSLSLETFYKKQNNLLDFKDGAQLILNNHLETDFLQGKGIAYGIETAFSKTRGILTGTINYTYSRSMRTIRGNYIGESINKGKTYPSNFDQPNMVNVSWKLGLSKRHFFTGNFTYRTGRPVTVPLAAFEFENTTVTYFSGRNQYRIPDYHRLDLALVIEGNHKRKKIGEGTWIFSVYNVYGRRNPYTVFFKGSDDGRPKPYQLSIIGTIFPSVSFNFKF